jgi:hypothetical protein
LPAQPALARCASPNTPDGLLTKDLELALMRKTFVALLTLCLRLSPRQTATRSTFKDALNGRGLNDLQRIRITNTRSTGATEPTDLKPFTALLDPHALSARARKLVKVIFSTFACLCATRSRLYRRAEPR